MCGWAILSLESNRGKSVTNYYQRIFVLEKKLFKIFDHRGVDFCFSRQDISDLKKYLALGHKKNVNINNMCNWIKDRILLDIFPNLDIVLRIYKWMAVSNYILRNVRSHA